jgi:ribosome-binding protein aMBF1 (putative translation factor)
MESFGKWIKAERYKKGMGLWRLACSAHVGGEALRLIEVGKSNPAGCKVETLYGIAKVLGLDLVEVIERAMMERPDILEYLEKNDKCKVN